jgi:hypothetical protein
MQDMELSQLANEEDMLKILPSSASKFIEALPEIMESAPRSRPGTAFLSAKVCLCFSARQENFRTHSVILKQIVTVAIVCWGRQLKRAGNLAQYMQDRHVTRKEVSGGGNDDEGELVSRPRHESNGRFVGRACQSTIKSKISTMELLD